MKRPARAISETVPDSAAARERERPRLFDQELERIWGRIGIFDDGSTRRIRMNIYDRNRAATCLRDNPAFAWLITREGMDPGQREGYRKVVLAELGQIVDEDEMRGIALNLCELKPKAREAVAMIRRHRLGSMKRGDPEALSRGVVRAVVDYLARHPDTTWQQVLEALYRAADQVRMAAAWEDDEL